MFKKLTLAAASTFTLTNLTLTNLALAHSDPNAHGAVMAQVPHLHFGSGHVVALGVVGVFVAILIAAVVKTGSATKSPRKRR